MAEKKYDVGAIVPVPRGMMRNKFFPTRVADYVTMPELKRLKAENVPIERDHAFGMEKTPPPSSQSLLTPLESDVTPAPVRKAPEVEKLTPERSMELLDIFVPHRMDFYRQPIVEEKVEEPEPEPEPVKKEERRQRTASSAASDLLAARSQPALKRSQPKTTGGIYGSVSAHDILVAVRASIARNDEASRVILTEQDIAFLDAASREEGKIKKVGDFTVELKVKGVEEGLKRTVRVIPQEV